MVMHVPVNPAFFPWAIERARGDVEALAHRFPKLGEWVQGQAQPTLKQLEDFAKATHAPVGFFFLPEPPQESLPLSDFRTLEGKEIAAPSADLLDTIYICQQRQEWYRDFARSMGEPTLSFVGSLTIETEPVEAARIMVQQLRFELKERKDCKNWGEALRALVAHCEELGVLVMIDGVVANNTHRVLDPQEFRGFCLVDAHAPLVFINGADSKSAQMFTLMHELAHLWLGEGGVSNSALNSTGQKRIEVWCNAVAAEILVPLVDLEREFDPHLDFEEELARLRKAFKVSSLVILRRLLDLGALSRAQFGVLYGQELARLSQLKSEKSSGGNFYNSEAVRVSRRFATALLVSTYEGNTLFRDASRLLGIKKSATVDEFASRLGVH